MIRSSIVALTALIALAACGSGSERQASAATVAPAIENGRLIYQTGEDSRDVRVRAQPAAMYPRCAACHGANGAGGMKLPGGAVSADLRHKALVTDQKHPYTLALLQRAISTGVDNEGQRLSPVMPRWKMSKRDLHDVAEYVLTQLH